MGQIRISIAGPERLDDVEALWWQLHEHHMSVEHDRNARIRDERQTWEARRKDLEFSLGTPGGFMVVADEEAEDGSVRPVGFCVVGLRRNHNWRVHGEYFAELETLSVAPEARGKGIGKQLMEAVYGRAREAGAHELQILVVEGNDGARRFYEREGFTPWHVTYFGPIPGED